ncbi:hypothetical protein J7J26_00460 [Candidatus Micrarchaeota archaeon]|nr:hypothetical protein [Candidatus Micrarchaeota archaeon]
MRINMKSLLLSNLSVPSPTSSLILAHANGQVSNRVRSLFRVGRVKGQVSTEYILLLSIVLILGLVVVSLVLDVPNTLRVMTSRGSNEFWLNSDISIKAHTYYSDGRLVMIIKNSKTYEITIVKAIINDHTYTLNQKLVPGEQRTVTLLTDACNTGTNYILNIKFYFYDDDDRSRGLLSFGPDIPLTGICEEISEE